MPGHMKPTKDLKSDIATDIEYQFKGALCGFGEDIQDLNFNEVITQTRKYSFFFFQ